MSDRTPAPMKHWKESAEVVARAVELAAVGRRAAIATVVRVTGSAYRQPGAKFLVEGDGRTLGGVSGGCLEADVREVALHVIHTGVPRLLHYDTGGDDHSVWGLGLGCYGSVDIFVQSTAVPDAAAMVRTLHRLLSGDDPFAVCAIVDGASHVGRWVVATASGAPLGSDPQSDIDRGLLRAATACLKAGASRLEELGSQVVFAEIFTPAPPLIVFGAGDDARPLAAYATQSGFRVTVVDHRAALVTADRFPPPARVLVLRPEDDLSALAVDSRTSVVIQTHSLGHDREWLRRVLQTDARYIGLLGPRARKHEILQQIGAADDGRLFGPVGLDLGADGPEQIAISILAELLAVRARRAPGHLRDRGMAIHGH